MAAIEIVTELADKAAFATTLPLLTQATAENDNDTPGYMFAEIEALTFQSRTLSHQVSDYLIRRLEKPSPTTKLKVLKIMSHLVCKGHISFRQYLRASDESLKMAALYHGPADPLLGTSQYEAIRKHAKDLLQALFDTELLSQEETQSETRAQFQLGGLGSSGSIKGKYEGFGSSPLDKEETIKDKMLDMVEKILHPVDKKAETIRMALTTSPGQYEAVKVEDSVLQLSPPMTINTSNKIKFHVPGRAGGGWESDDDDMQKLGKSSSRNSLSQLSTDSLENLESSAVDDTPEMQVVMQFCNIRHMPCSLLSLHDTCKRCSSLNCVDVLKAVSLFLEAGTHTDMTILRALLILEWFLRTDLVATATVSKLVSCQISKLMKSETEVSAQVKLKAEKVSLILNRLQSV